MRGLICTSIVVVWLSSIATAEHQITPVVLQGDDVADIGPVTAIDRVTVNDNGQWLVEASTDHPPAARRGVYLRGEQTLAGFVVALRTGDPLSEPPGTSARSVWGFSLDTRSNDIAWNLSLGGTGGKANDQGIFINDELVIQEGDVCTASGFSPGTSYRSLQYDAKIYEDSILMAVIVDDPNIPGSVNPALIGYDHASGVQFVVAKQGDERLPGRPYTPLGPWPHQMAYAGAFLYFAILTGDSASDGSIWLGDQLIAQEGSPSPEPGADYELLSDHTLAMTAPFPGQRFAFTAKLDGDAADDEVIVRKLPAAALEIVHREGDSPADIAPFQITGFGSTTTPIALSAARVVWFGKWNDPDTSRNAGIFRGEELLVQKGVTLIDGKAITSFATGDQSISASPNGEWILFHATLEGDVDGAFLISGLSGICCLGDAGGGDLDVDVDDLLDVLDDFPNSGPIAPGDTDCDNDTDVDDLLQVLANFGAPGCVED